MLATAISEAMRPCLYGSRHTTDQTYSTSAEIPAPFQEELTTNPAHTLPLDLTRTHKEPTVLSMATHEQPCSYLTARSFLLAREPIQTPV